MQFLHQLHLLKLFSPLISIPLFLSGCTTITYPDGTTASTLNVPPPCDDAYGGGYPVCSPCGVGVYSGGYYPVYGNCFRSGWGSWGGGDWYRAGGGGYVNNSGNTTINVNRTTAVTGTSVNSYSRSMNATYGSYNHTATYRGSWGNTSMRSVQGTSGNLRRSPYGGGIRGMH